MNKKCLSRLALIGSFAFLVPVCAAQVTGVAPGCGPAAGGTPISITGANFVGITSVTIGGAPLLNVVVANSGLITGQTPPGSAGQKDVTVCNPQGCSTLTGAFAYTPATAPNLVFDGSFELIPPTEYFGGTSIGGWSVLGDGIDVYTNASFWQAAAGVTSIDLNKSAPGAVEQSISTNPGSTYLVTFSMAANVAQGPLLKQLQVSAAGQSAVFTFDGSGFSNSNMGWRCKSWTFTATATGTALRFTSQTSGPCGPALDDIAVYELTTLTAPPVIAIGGSLNYALMLSPLTPYILDVSTTGTAPGSIVNGVHIPLNPPYLNYQYGAMLPGVFVNFVAFSDAAGAASAAVNVPNAPVLIGTPITAVFVALDMVAPSGIGAVAGPVTTTIVGPAPIITSVLPSTGPSTGGTAISVSGANFTAGATVKIGGVVVSNPAVTPSFIVCTTPPGVIGPADVQVENPGGLFAALPGGFTYVPLLVVSSVTPGTAPAGASVTIGGSGIQPGATAVVGGIPAQVTSSTQTTLTFTMPVNVPCDTTIVVTNPDTQVAAIAFNPTPVITGVVNASGPAAGGSSFAMLGSQFLPGTIVTVGGAQAAITFQSSTFLVCAAPPGSVGPAPIVVSSAGGCTASSTFQYQ